MHIKTLTVSQLNSYIKKIIDSDFILRNSEIKGEISNFKFHSSGHIYFSLKDQYSKINCIMFRSYAEGLNFMPQNGDNVILKGRISVYQKDGVYQFYCEKIEKEGIGDLFIAFEELKNKLSKKGLFEDEHKKNIPKHVNKIGIITSPTGAAIRDIINVAKRRNPKVQLLIYPSLVQGDEAQFQIIEGIKYFDSREDIDIIILARGGGSIEELWSFNDENLAYAIYDCSKPIISGVGHETDFTICDFVSDKRASTPSVASEIAIFRLDDLNEKIYSYKDKLYTIMENTIDLKYKDLDGMTKNLKMNSPMKYIANQYINVDKLKDKITYIINSKVDYKKGQLTKINSLLYAHNPLNILNKGFAIIQDANEGIITESGQIKNGDSIKIILKKGKVKAQLSNVQNIKSTIKS